MNTEKLREKTSELKTIQSEANYSCNWMIDGLAKLVYAYILFYKPDLVIHTGFLWGKSSLFILEALSDIDESIETGNFGRDVACVNFILEHSPQKVIGKLIAIDPNMFNIDVDKIVKILDEEYDIDFYKMTSQEYFNKHSSDIVGKYKFILGVVDGDHTVNGCMNDLVQLHNLGAKVILVDDTIWLPELNKVCEQFSNKNNYYYCNNPLYTGLGILVRKEIESV